MDYSKTEDGKIKDNRKYETLEYYFIDPAKTKTDKEHNKLNLEMAKAVKVKRLLASQNKQYGFIVEYKIRTNLIEYIKGLIDQRRNSPGNYGNRDSSLKHLIAYGYDTIFEKVDKPFVEGFKNYLAKEAPKKVIPTFPQTAKAAFLKLKATLNQALEDGIIPHNPASSVKPAKVEDVHREYLTFEELQRLVKVECKFPILKQAFIFSC